ncbi:MAG: hypothetical protein K6F69_11130 [Treponema sp.]|nr:hypothetical protein [Treponema sp.]
MANSVYRKYRSFFTCLFLSLLVSCGMDVVYYLSAPTVTYNDPTYATSDYASKYFAFLTEEDQDVSDFTFDGTGVYYKIYNNYSTMVTRNSAISAVNTTSNSSSAATKMIETYGYKPLGCIAGPNSSSALGSPLISDSGSNTKVYIRLTTYGDAADYSDSSSSYYFTPKILLGTSSDDGSIPSYIPMRYGNKYSFDFGRSSSSGFDTSVDIVPANGDDDVTYGTSSVDGTWYVDMYAVAIGHDNSFTQYYSLVLHLGAIPIVEGEEN